MRLFGALVVARQIAFVVRINDMPVARVSENKSAFTAARWIPIARTNHTFISAARDADVRVVLLRAVDVIWKRVIDGDVIELRSRLIIYRRPCFPSVRRNARAAIVCISYPVWIFRINPEPVVIP